MLSKWHITIMSITLGVLTLLPPLAEWLDEPFYIELFARIMIFAIAAVSLDLILGFGGMVSFGHAAYLGTGGYAVAIFAFYGIDNGFLQCAAAILGSGLIALIIGAISLRTSGVYFIMITLAFTQMLFFFGISLEEYGGDDGLVIEQRSEFTGVIDMESTLEFYYVVLVFLVGALYLVSRIVNARFGMVVQGAKANDERMQSLGFDTFRYRLACYVIAGAMAAAAGWLMGNYNYFFSPEMMSWTHSGELIFMVVLGGAGTMFGPVLGAIVLIILEELLSSATVYWPLILGAILIAVVLFARGGLEGALAMLERRK